MQEGFVTEHFEHRDLFLHLYLFLRSVLQRICVYRLPYVMSEELTSALQSSLLSEGWNIVHEIDVKYVAPVRNSHSIGSNIATCV